MKSSNTLTCRVHGGIPNLAAPGCCFAPETLVMTPGCPTPIQQLRQGDEIISYDLTAGRLVRTRIERVDVFAGHFDLFEVAVGRGGRPILATPNHLFFDGQDWTLCADLRMALTSTGDVHAAHSFFLGATANLVYNLRTKYGTYLVGDDAAIVRGGKAARTSSLSGRGKMTIQGGSNLPLADELMMCAG